jgi:gag-polyprotein putative aspartyl protease
MSRIASFNPIAVLLACTVCLPAIAATTNPTDPTPGIVTARIRLDDYSMIIVPVSINGSAPVDFLLDTGASSSIMDQKLADQLTLPQVGVRKLVGVLGTSQISVVSAGSVSVAGAIASDLNISVTSSRMTVSKVRGVLGQDFLQRFDVLIDYRHLTLQLAPTSGSLAESLTGEHLQLRVDPSNPALSAPNRLILSGNVPELGKSDITLLLDSGANQFTLFHQDLGVLASRNEKANTGNFGAWNNLDVASRKVHFVSLGASSVPDVTVVTIAHSNNADTDGLIPTSFFHSVFISSHNGFVILNPKPHR